MNPFPPLVQHDFGARGWWRWWWVCLVREQHACASFGQIRRRRPCRMKMEGRRCCCVPCESGSNAATAPDTSTPPEIMDALLDFEDIEVFDPAKAEWIRFPRQTLLGGSGVILLAVQAMYACTRSVLRSATIYRRHEGGAPRGSIQLLCGDAVEDITTEGGLLPVLFDRRRGGSCRALARLCPNRGKCFWRIHC
ncbi:hypothetical protein GWK47_008846 [Chionoecetes opilio]|uniref:Uncharacterized protein n=1 Tax=Chionoecetes opilio TaxID=41210 RepID=A0A8J4XZH0_CHIOP|nr:hypothetical protein GWK47_008846 [Chionoecetes opilio]